MAPNQVFSCPTFNKLYRAERALPLGRTTQSSSCRQCLLCVFEQMQVWLSPPLSRTEWPSTKPPSPNRKLLWVELQQLYSLLKTERTIKAFPVGSLWSLRTIMWTSSVGNKRRMSLPCLSTRWAFNSRYAFTPRFIRGLSETCRDTSPLGTQCLFLCFFQSAESEPNIWRAFTSDDNGILSCRFKSTQDGVKIIIKRQSTVMGKVKEPLSF